MKNASMSKILMRTKATSKVCPTPGRIITSKLVILAALTIALTFTHPASGQAVAASAGRLCSVATLRGQYSWVGNGFMKVPDQNDPSKTVTVPSASIAFLTMGGNGRFDLVITVVFDGNLVRENHRVSDTYLVNPDCTGVLGSGIEGPSFDILVVRDGSSFLLIDKNPGGTAASEVKRIK
jgi:hypothetical protein